MRVPSLHEQFVAAEQLLAELRAVGKQNTPVCTKATGFTNNSSACGKSNVSA